MEFWDRFAATDAMTDVDLMDFGDEIWADCPYLRIHLFLPAEPISRLVCI